MARSVLDRMLRRNPLAAMAMHRHPSRQASLQHLASALTETAPAPSADEDADAEAEEAAEVRSQETCQQLSWNSCRNELPVFGSGTNANIQEVILRGGNGVRL